MEAILRNRARCKLCGDIIESLWRNDFRTCSCGNLHVDGGLDYIRRGFREGKDSFENMNEYGLDIMPFFSTGPGWLKMLDTKLKDFFEIDPTITEIHVKEKYGRADVSYYGGGMDDRLLAQEEILEKASTQTCELCGNPGKVRNDHGWLQCRCDRCHAAGRDERRDIMKQTFADYENYIRETLKPYPELLDIELSEKDKAYIRYAVWDPEEIEATVKEVLKGRFSGNYDPPKS